MVATTDLTQYKYVIMVFVTDSVGAKTTNMDIIQDNVVSGSYGQFFGVAQNVQNGQYFGKTTGSGTTMSYHCALGLK